LLFGCSGWSTPAGGENPGVRRVTVDRPDLPLAKLRAEELDRFRQGDALFEAVVRESDGLGPLYVRDACAACHQSDGRGPGLVTKMSVTSDDARLRTELLPFGTTERPYTSAGAKLPLLAKTDERLRVTQRLPPAVFGRGYLEAIADRDLEQLAAKAAQRTGSARGRLNRLADGKIGRFGIKARLATLGDFAADALSGDMGITSPAYPEEPAGPEGLRDDHKPGVDFSEHQVELLRDYLRLLEVPERRTTSETGERLFATAGCADCHTPSFKTDAHYPVAALAGVEARVYSDLLLHDMGSAGADGQVEGSAGPRDFRTAPLMGLRFMPSYWHDGSAKTVADAIAAHGHDDSEGRDSWRAFQALSPRERQELVRFVEAL
jgi:CxxC motif-containing protein (DUF1111 family)